MICHCDGPPHPYDADWCGRGKFSSRENVGRGLTPVPMRETYVAPPPPVTVIVYGQENGQHHVVPDGQGKHRG